MKPPRITVPLLALALILMACSVSLVTPVPTVQPTSTPRLAPTRVRATPTNRPSAAPTSSATATSTPSPTQTATATATATPTATPSATATLPGTREVFIFLIAPQDNGASGPRIGCGDSVIGVRRQLATPTQSPMQAAYEELFSLDDYYYDSGLVNPLEPSSLAVDRVSISNGLAVVELSGNLALMGTCEDARIEAQLEYTALQFPTVEGVRVTINGTLLQDLTAQG